MPVQARRVFLSQVGRSFATMQLWLSDEAQLSFSQTSEFRAHKALRLRLEAAQAQYHAPLPPQETNGDSDKYASYLATYSKGLPHNSAGLVDPLAYQQLLKALDSGQWADFEALPLGGAAKLSDPLAAFTFALEGCDSHHTWTPTPPSFAGDEQAHELIELYWQALTRDVPFAAYNSDPLMQQACADLTPNGPTTLPRVQGAVTPDTLFRTDLPGCLIGPYVSQFLWLSIPIDNLVIPQAYPGLAAGSDRLTQYPDWLAIQNGVLPGPSAPLAAARYIITARDLVSYVHRDVSCQAALNAALILNSLGTVAWSDANPYKRSRTQSSFVAFGAPGLLDWVVRAANAALRAAWYQKWLVHRRLRPEEFAGRVQNQLVAKIGFPISECLFRSSVLERVYAKQGSYLLAQAYDEGCPTHPSYPAAHATIAGACITVLKALFNEAFVIPQPVIPSPDGSTLLPYAEQPLTLGGELNKLAANVALARDAAGVHWRSDSLAGLQLGEQVAMALLRDLVRVASDDFAPLTFQDFQGQPLEITAS